MRSVLNVVAALALLVAACTGAAHAQAPPMKLWTSSAIVEVDSAPLFLGQALGVYASEGVQVQLGSAAGSAATLQLVASGQVDMGHIGMDVLILAKARNPTLPVTAVYLHYRGNIYEIVVPADGDIETVADLKDKNIGVANLASGAIPSLRATLGEAGLNPDTSVGLIPVGIGAQALASLRSGRVQALALFRAQHAAIEALGTRFRSFTRASPSTVIVVNDRVLREQPGRVVKVLRGIAAGSAFAEANPQATVREYWTLYGKPQGLTEADAMGRSAHVLARTSELWKRSADTATPWGAMAASDWDAMSQFLISQKLLASPVAAGSLFTTNLLADVNTVDLAPVLKRAAEAK